MGSTVEPSYIQNSVITNHVIKRLMCTGYLLPSFSGHLGHYNDTIDAEQLEVIGGRFNTYFKCFDNSNSEKLISLREVTNFAKAYFSSVL